MYIYTRNGRNSENIVFRTLIIVIRSGRGKTRERIRIPDDCARVLTLVVRPASFWKSKRTDALKSNVRRGKPCTPYTLHTRVHATPLR